MPQNKDLKRLVRTRMKKTGESYTAARAQVLRKPRRKTTARSTTAPARAARAALASPAVAEYATIAGMSDDVVKAKTGCTWERWVKALDRAGAATLSHAEIAKLVNDKYKVGPWWGQMVTVGYERIKGLRARGQQRDGSYGASKSRTFNVPVERLFDAWADASLRKQWLDGKAVKVRTATAPKSLRLDWPDGGIIAVGFQSKGAAKSSVALEHTKLPDRETANQLKQYWTGVLDKLGAVLGE
jgi:uncharacterized protein YndB with AHSA1/START domain